MLMTPEYQYISMYRIFLINWDSWEIAICSNYVNLIFYAIYRLLIIIKTIEFYINKLANYVYNWHSF